MKILRELLFHLKTRFSDLNIDNLTNDHFTYHINKLIQIGFIDKAEDDFQKLENKFLGFDNFFINLKKGDLFFEEKLFVTENI